MGFVRDMAGCIGSCRADPIRAELARRRDRDDALLSGAASSRHEQCPGNERLVVEYLAGVLKAEGIPFEIRALDPRSAQPGGAEGAAAENGHSTTLETSATSARSVVIPDHWLARVHENSTPSITNARAARNLSCCRR